MEICSELIQRRRQRKMKQADIAKLIGVTPPNISYLENGTGTVGLNKLIKTAEAYGGNKHLALRLLQKTHPKIWRIVLQLREQIVHELSHDTNRKNDAAS